MSLKRVLWRDNVLLHWFRAPSALCRSNEPSGLTSPRLLRTWTATSLSLQPSSPPCLPLWSALHTSPTSRCTHSWPKPADAHQLRNIFVLTSSWLGEGETVAQLTKRLPKDAAAAFIYSQLLSWPLTHTHVRTFLWRYLRSSLTNLSLILLELSFCPNKAPKLSLTLAYTLTLSSPNIPSSDIKPGIFWWATTGLP